MSDIEVIIGLLLLFMTVPDLCRKLGRAALVFSVFVLFGKHDGPPLEDYFAPISHRFLIPIFFVSLGLQVDWRLLLDSTALLAAGSAGLLLGAREILHRRWLKTGGDHRAFLLLCLNLT